MFNQIGANCRISYTEESGFQMWHKVVRQTSIVEEIMCSLLMLSYWT